MARSRGIQVAVAIGAAVILAVLIYVWGVPRRAAEPTAPAPVASAPAAPSTTATPAPQGSAGPPGQAVSPAGAGAPQQASAPQAPGSRGLGSPAPGSRAPGPEIPASQSPGQGQASTRPQPSATALSFDVVRVEPDGSSVIAGRAPPGSKVELLRNGQPIGTVVADASGAFAMVPPPLEPGTHELSLRCSLDGKTLESGDTVSVVIADDRKTAPMVALLSPNKPAQVLSRPSGQAAAAMTSAGTRTNAAAPLPSPAATGARPQPAAPTAAAAPAAGASRSGVVVDTVEAEDGRMFVSGRAAPSATVRLYLNDSYVGSAVTGPAGQLSFTIERGLAPGEYRVRLDDVEPTSGAVNSRAEVAFTMPAPAVVGAVSAPAPGLGGPVATAPSVAGTAQPSAAGGSVIAKAPAENAASSAVVIPEVNTTTVVRGDNLWRISRRVYGRGARYTVIYDANHNQIRNHHLIYPGQVFVLPRG
ncbi:MULTISPECIES: LysM peptidoglycan-binding domain-containing protein [unclassified Chelatococcus]|uniref:LysM peptidoglycan-binding domain-containing protein n=1 Tax=unclassified Chelatococcus TaxID=2638111 RepID=UPI001BCB1A90|nr:MULTISPECIES: LysM peptidoglycan-binding domain-containing protein [unclassified Chelatococcus]MBS7698651.1 LysM peptidoglycan-binding domain-containing protein [Chelatococcus sp. YT9]MBX3554767.1 LysM peptidoglycan-binding domain-containing protein [Chelatococcus sp.]